MGLFSKKLTGEDVLEALKNLSRDELIAIKEALAGYGEKKAVEENEGSSGAAESTVETTDAAEENGPDNSEGADAVAEDSENGENSAGETASEAEQDENAPVEENGAESENNLDFETRFKAIEEEIKRLAARLDAEAVDSAKEAADGGDNNGEDDAFGLHASGANVDTEKSSKSVLEETRKKYFGF